jgi:hypothetical protein
MEESIPFLDEELQTQPKVQTQARSVHHRWLWIFHSAAIILYAGLAFVFFTQRDPKQCTKALSAWCKSTEPAESGTV